MKLFNRAAALTLCAALTLGLASCAVPSGDSKASPSPSVSGTGELKINVDTTDLTYELTGIRGDDSLLTVNGVPVKAKEYCYWLSYAASYKDSYMRNYGADGIDWSATYEDSMTQSDYLKKDALQSCLYYSLIASKAVELNFPLTNENKAELDANIAAATERVGGADVLRENLRTVGIDEQMLYSMNSVNYLYAQLVEGLFSDRPTDEEMARQIQENDLLSAKHILLMTVDGNKAPLDEAAIAQKKAAAEDLLAQLNASADPLTLFDQLMNEHSEDSGLAANPDGYLFTAGDMVPEFETATRQLAFNAMSEIVESSFGYHIILRLDPDTPAARDDYRSSLMDDQLQVWIDEAKVELTDAYQNIDAKVYFERYVAYQEAFAAQSAQPSPSPAQ